MKFFKSKKKNDEKKRNQKLTTDIMRIRINRLINSTPVEIGVFDAELTRDKNNNTIIFSEEHQVKEELPGLYDSLISDVLYKLESRGLSLPEQITKLNTLIEKQNKQIQQERNGYVKTDSEDETKQIKVNIQSEKTKLRLLKCVKYTLENKKGEGFFESIELDGTRSLTYLIRDGDLIPYWHKTPNSEGEPVILVPDIVQRKKFWKEATDETINDFNENQDTFWKGILGVITKGLFVLAFLGLIIWTIHNARWNSDLYDESLEPQIQQLQLENERIRQLCSSQVANQIENNEVLIEYAKDKLEKEKSVPPPTNQDKSNIQI